MTRTRRYRAILRHAVLAAVVVAAVCGGATGLLAQTVPVADTVQLVPQLGMGAVRSVAFSADNRLVLTGSDDGLVRLWDVATAAQVRSYEGSVGVFAPGGKTVATACKDWKVRLWDVATGRLVREFAGHGGRVDHVAFNADGTLLLTASFDKTARLWDVASGKELHTLAGHTGPVSFASFSADGQYVVTSSADHTARLWRTASGELVRSFNGGSDLVESAVFSPDGRYVLAGGRHDTDATRYNADGQARMWDVATGQLVRTFSGRFGYVDSVAFSPDGRFVLTGSNDNVVRVWNAQTGELLRSLHQEQANAAWVNCVSYSADGRYLLAGSVDSTVRVWSASSGELLHTLRGHSAKVLSVAAAKDGRLLLTGSSDGSARLWDLRTGRTTNAFAMDQPSDYVTSVAFSPDGTRVLLADLFNEADVWELDTNKKAVSLKEDGSPARFSTDGRYVMTHHRLWDAASGRLLRKYDDETVFSADGRSAMTWSSLSEMGEFLGSQLVNTPDGRLVAQKPKNNRSASVWNTTTGKELVHINDVDADVHLLAMSPDKRTVLTAEDVIRVRDTATGKTLRSFDGTTDVSGGAVALSDDGAEMLTGGLIDRAVRLWDTASATQRPALLGHTASVTSVDFLDGGRFVVSGSDDTTARIWDAKTGRQLATLVSFDNGGWAVVDPDGRFDSSDLDGDVPLVWVAASDPLRPLPIEIFTRDYYTPGLLARVLRGETLPPVRPIAEIKNRVQPEVTVTRVVASPSTPGRVDVTVHAASVKDAKGTQSGLRDLRLFRDGQMVANGYLPGALKDGDFTFKDVMLKSGENNVTFTAYGFNSERIKSSTAALAYKPVAVTAAGKPHAYLLQIGVNHYTASGCELRYAVNDATRLSAALTRTLESQGTQVEAVVLESPTGGDATGAAKQKVRDAIAAIAAKATPDDSFILSFSGHGYPVLSGQYYLLPSDVVGSCDRPDAALVASAISTDELAEWLRPLDAGEMAFVLDACHSAFGVSGRDFRPGPMGSQGLGQLAYDKRIRILAASQSNQRAYEYDSLQQGVLSYVLTHDGLVDGKADWKPIDHRIMVGEWLGYAAATVLKFKAPAAGPGARNAAAESSEAQLPVVFDFSKGDGFVLEQTQR